MAVDPNQIDGDRLIAFINAVQHLGRLLEEMNVMEVKDAFLVGRKLGSIESIIEQEKAWKKCVLEITAELERNSKVLELGKQEYQKMLGSMKQCVSFCQSSELERANSQLKQFADLCDRLQKHKESGTFELVQQILK